MVHDSPSPASFDEHAKLVRSSLPKHFDWADEYKNGPKASWLVDEAIQKEGIGFLVGKT